MSTATVRIPETKRDILKIIASHPLLSRPEWVKIIQQGKSEVARGVKGKALDELED